MARATRAVLSGMFGLAVRHEAIPANPVRDTARMKGTPKKRGVLTIEQVRDLRAKLTTDQRALDVDLVDFVDMLLATGLRIGETAAITWAAIDDRAGTLEVRATVIGSRARG